MNIETAFKITYPKAIKVIRELELYAEECIIRGAPPFVNFSNDFISAMYGANYLELYSIARKKRDYQLLLKDESFIQLHFHRNSEGTIKKIRYSYFENPFNFETIEDLRFNYYLWDEYFDQLRDECSQKNHVTPIRYDFNVEHLKGNLHPVSHLHIGYNNNIRIPVSKILSPLAFICFVIKHKYYHLWINKKHDRSVECTFADQKKNCINLTADYFSEEEKKDLYLN